MSNYIMEIKEFPLDFERLVNAIEKIANEGINVHLTASDKFGGFDLHTVELREAIKDVATAICSTED